MRREIIAGFIPLLDCAVLAAAAELGFAEAEGLELRLMRESSWANIRDRLIVGHFQVAHLLGPMTLASTLGLGHLKVALIAPVALGLGGNAITVSRGLWKQMCAYGARAGAPAAAQGAALAQVIHQRVLEGAPPLTFAMVYPFSCHNYELRYWLAACGIDSDRDINVVVLPPPLLVAALRETEVDGFCVGEPWNSLAADADVGCIVAATSSIWRRSPEKVLGMRADWAERHPDEVAALIRALYRAALWCGNPGNHAELARLLSRANFVGAPMEILQRGLRGQLRLGAENQETQIPEFLVLERHHATMPRKTHALWFYSQMVRWGQVASSPERADAAEGTYRPDLYRSALASLELDLPLEDMPVITGDDFFDKREFDPRQLQSYAETVLKR